MREKVRKWVNLLSDFERRLPLIIHEGEYYSPGDVLSEVEANTALGADIQADVLDAGRISVTASGDHVTNLAVERLITLHTERPATLYSLSAEYPVVTSEEMIEAIRERTDLGLQEINMEVKHMQDIVNYYGRR